MMKKQISSLVLAGALLLGTAAPLVANADGTTGNTKSTVNFTAPANETKPVDPDNPGTSVDTVDPGENGTTPSGNLTFLYVSPAINFGSHTISMTGPQTISNLDKAGSVSVTSQDFGTTANTNLVTEIADTRGTNAGWNVQVTSSELKNGDNKLDGAKIDLNATDVTGNTVKNSADSTGISGSDAELPTDGTSGVQIYNATAGNGAGKTAFQLSPDNITMTGIPANVVAGTYTGTLTWTLNDSPKN